MPRDVARAALYRGAINLWVEDELTRAYLSEIWNDARVAFLIGGGNEGVRAIVKVAEAAEYSNVFGLIDRDFRPSNQESWHDPAKTFHTFILPVHEVENYLLDARALEQSRYHNRGLSVAEIEAHLNNAARRLCWWAACCEVVAVLRKRFHEKFIPNPSQAVRDGFAAKDHICKSHWYSKLADEAARSGADEIQELLDVAHFAAEKQLEDGTWRENFAGKEILRDVGSRISDRIKIPPREAEFHADLAKEIAAWQVANGEAPPSLAELLAALKARIAAQSSG